MKNDNKGFTLLELIIATTIVLIISLGFFAWSTTIIQSNLSIEKNNTAYAILNDIADRLQRMPDNALIKPKAGNAKYIGYDTGGVLRGCTGNNPDVNLGVPGNLVGLTINTDPFRVPASGIYLYDGNNCEGRTWIDPACGSGANVSITPAGNPRIDHPNATGSAYDIINPIRSYRNTTYYAVWSVAYMPCNAADTNRRKIFLTVYWIDPEPTVVSTSGASGLNNMITGGTAVIKSVSLVIDKVIGTET